MRHWISEQAHISHPDVIKRDERNLAACLHRATRKVRFLAHPDQCRNSGDPAYAARGMRGYVETTNDVENEILFPSTEGYRMSLIC